jgi:hypothetical protein
MTRSAVRAALYIIGGLLVVGGIALAVIGCFPPAAGLALWGVILIIGLLIERWRYQPLGARSPGPDWTATDERFVDPETGKLVTVYFNQATGERRYVAI